MRSLHILIVTHAPLTVELGAGQAAINLAEALRGLGHDVVLWSPHPLPTETRWWRSVQQMRSQLNAFIKTQNSFDVIDSPAMLITKNLSCPVVVARSVQPDILYLLHSLNSHIDGSIRSLIRAPFSYLYSLFQVFLVFQGWRKANHILCLGSLEKTWMRRWFPYWQAKLDFYYNTVSETDQKILAEAKSSRQKTSGDTIHFLWIGRWVAHKGTATLLNFIKHWSNLRSQDTFTIAGCGVEAQQIGSADFLQAHNVKVIPSFKRSELHSLLTSHDVGLFTSKVEGWGLILNEMLESGMPVFATTAGGVPDLQPFFSEQLKPFPPSSQIVLETLLNLLQFRVSEEYYGVFTWREIAESYIKIVSSSLCAETYSNID